MSKLEALQDLLAKCEAGDVTAKDKLANWPDFDFEGKGYGYKVNANMALAYNGSLDAAKALHDAVLPGWRPRIELGGFNEKNMMRDKDIWTVILWHTNPNWIHSLIGPTGQSNSPARAWACAILKTLIAMEIE